MIYKKKYVVGAVLLINFFVWILQGNAWADSGKQVRYQPEYGMALVTDIKPITPVRDFVAPQWSPNGDYLTFSKQGYDALFLFDFSTREHQTLVEEPFSGYAPRWSADSNLLHYRQQGQEFTANLVKAVSPYGVKTDSVYRPAFRESAQFFVEKDQIHLRLKSADHLGFAAAKTITDQSDKYYAPLLSPDGAYLLYEGIATGIHVRHLASGDTLSVGRGNHPTWSKDSRYIVFDRTEDDGERLTAGELILYDLSKSRTVVLTDTPHIIEQRPTLSPTNDKIAFDANGTIFIGNMTY